MLLDMNGEIRWALGLRIITSGFPFLFFLCETELFLSIEPTGCKKKKSS